MKKILLMITMLTLLLISAESKKNPTVPLVIVNKSGMEIAVRLDGENIQNFYYFTLPKGDRDIPVERSYDITRDTYQLAIYYLEIYDPVYGYTCGNLGSRTYLAQHKVRITVLECNVGLRAPGEPPLVKYPLWYGWIY